MTGREGLARELLAALDAGRTVSCPSDDGLDLPAAYAVAADIERMRIARGERRVGRKIGFTNRGQWEAFGVVAPIWGAMYSTTVRPNTGTFALGNLPEPKIEPEIVFRLGARPEPAMDEVELMACISHVGHGFEIVRSPFPGWRLRAPDAVAAAGLHAALVHGPLVEIVPSDRDNWRRGLAAFQVTLARDGMVVEEGTSRSIVESGPVAALGLLVRIIAADRSAPALDAGEIISTGSLTAALQVAPGEVWSTELQGLQLDGLRLRFVGTQAE